MLVGLVADYVVGHAAPVVDALVCVRVGLPGVCGPHVDVVLGLGDHLVIGLLKRTLTRRRVETYVISHVPWVYLRCVFGCSV
jgi:hypothetical protein